jgi:hypothetical protein
MGRLLRHDLQAPPPAAVVMPAAHVGHAAAGGLPAGRVGSSLSFGHGIALWVLRLLTAGLRLPVIAHFAVNATIVALLLARLVSWCVSEATDPSMAPIVLRDGAGPTAGDSW